MTIASQIAFIFCIASAVLLWASTLGYLLVLELLIVLKRRHSRSDPDLPAVAAVVPVLNEESAIARKLSDLKRSLYPPDKIRWLIVDGGSRDRTVDVVKEAISRGDKIELISLPDTRTKAEQVHQVLSFILEEIIILTDADSSLDPACIGELVHALSIDAKTGLVGTTVKPETRLQEEQIHWRFLNHFWWLEGEALSCAGLSGVCYAVRREVLSSLAPDARSEDTHLGLSACRLGFGVKLSRRALATELRVPRTAAEFLSYRRRRGSCYLAEFQNGTAAVKEWRWRFARSARLWQLQGTPWLSLVAFLSGALLLTTRYWLVPCLISLAFGVPLLLLSAVLSRRSQDRTPWPRLFWATGRFAILFLASLVLLKKSLPEQGPIGGRT
jgi:cellulose synthase/poly-beta-1,6-N-acetylglucosamine synthase-like glycosyltransferase